MARWTEVRSFSATLKSAYIGSSRWMTSNPAGAPGPTTLPRSTSRCPTLPAIGADEAVLEVQLRSFHCGPAEPHLGLEHGDGASPRVVVLLRDGIRLEELLDARELHSPELEGRQVPGEAGLGRVELRLVGARVDREEQGALL